MRTIYAILLPARAQSFENISAPELAEMNEVFGQNVGLKAPNEDQAHSNLCFCISIYEHDHVRNCFIHLSFVSWLVKPMPMK